MSKNTLNKKTKLKNNFKAGVVIALLLLFVVCFVPINIGKGFKTSEVSQTKTSSTVEEVKESLIVKKETKKASLSYEQYINQKIKDSSYTGHLNIPLKLQTDSKWKNTPYGFGNSDEPNNIEINGCAIVSLSMIGSYMEGKEVTPLDILDWSKNDFFVSGQGTSWSIFKAYAEEKGYVCQEISDISVVASFLKEGHPVIVSVRPGYFTRTGHIMVLSGIDEKGNFWINDPNDSEKKGNSKRTYSADEITNDALNFWVFYK